VFILAALFYAGKVGTEKTNLFFSSVIDFSLTVQLDSPKQIEVVSVLESAADVSWKNISLPADGGYELYYKLSSMIDYSSCPAASVESGCQVVYPDSFNAGTESQASIDKLYNAEYDFLLRSFVGGHRSSAVDCESCEEFGVLISASSSSGDSSNSLSDSIAPDLTPESSTQDLEIHQNIPLENSADTAEESDKPEKQEIAEEEAKDQKAINIQQPISDSTTFDPKTSAVAGVQTKNLLAVPSSENFQFEEFSHSSAGEPPTIALFNLFVDWLAENEIIKFTKVEQVVRITFFGVKLQFNISQLVAGYCDMDKSKRVIKTGEISCDIIKTVQP